MARRIPGAVTAPQTNSADAVIRGRRSVAFAASLVSFAVSQSAMGARPIRVDHVVAGAASVTTVGSRTVIRAADRTIIDFTQFDVAKGQFVQFIQPSSHATVLDRILSQTPANIDGTISANGIVYFVDNAGVVFGPHSVVTANQIFAAGGGMKNSDFTAGQNNFELASSVVNNGVINSAAVALTGISVINNGSITASNGVATFAVGNDVFIQPRNETMSVKVTASGAANFSQTGSIQNNGTVKAPHGSVSMVSGDVYSIALGITSKVSAPKIEIAGGKFAKTQVSGSLDASNASGLGGTIHITGQVVAVSAATLDASGSTGGGSIRVGGDFHGGSSLLSAQTTTVDSASTLNASAIHSGAGGNIAVWSDDATAIHGNVIANGIDGNGGYIETSGKGTLDIQGITLKAVGKNSGTWLMDPSDVVIENASQSDANIFDTGTGKYTAATSSPIPASVIAMSDIVKSLSNGTNVTIETTNDRGTAGTGAGDITVKMVSSFTGDTVGLSQITVGNSQKATLTLHAAGSLYIESPVVATSGQLNVALGAASNVTITAPINTNSGSFTVEPVSGTQLPNAATPTAVEFGTGSSLVTKGGLVKIIAGQSIRLDGTGSGIDTTASGESGGSVTLVGNPVVGGGAPAVVISAPVKTAGGAVYIGQSGIDVSSVNINRTIDTSGSTNGQVQIYSSGAVAINSTINTINANKTGTAAVSLYVDGTATGDDITTGTGGSIYSLGTVTLSSAGGNISLVSSGGVVSNIQVTEAGKVSIAGSGDVGSVSATANSEVDITAENSIKNAYVTAGSSAIGSAVVNLTATNNDISSPNITVKGSSSPAGVVTLTALNGSITSPNVSSNPHMAGYTLYQYAKNGTSSGIVLDPDAPVSPGNADGVYFYSAGDGSLHVYGKYINGQNFSITSDGNIVVDPTPPTTVGITPAGLTVVGPLTLIALGNSTVRAADHVSFVTNGDISVTNSLSITSHGGGVNSSLTLTATGTVSQAQTISSTGSGGDGDTLFVGSTGIFNLTGANNVGAIGGKLTGGGSISFNNAGTLGIDSGGLSSESGSISVSAPHLTLNHDVSSASGSLSFTGGDLTQSTIANSANSIVISGTGTLISGSYVTFTSDSVSFAVASGATTVKAANAITIQPWGNSDVVVNETPVPGTLNLIPADLLALSASTVKISARGFVFVGAAGSLDLTSAGYGLELAAGSSYSILFESGSTAPTIKTAGLQTFDSPVELNADTTLTSSSGIIFKSDLGSTAFTGAAVTYSLTTNSATEFDGTVSGIRNLTVNGAATIGSSTNTIADAGVITTVGNQTYSNAVTLNVPATFTVGNAGTVTFNQAVTGASSSDSLTVSGASSVQANVTTAGAAQDYQGNVTIGNGITATLTGSTVTFESSGMLSGGSLHCVAGTTYFNGNVQLANLTVNGATQFGNATVATTGSQDYAGGTVSSSLDVTLNAGTTITFETSAPINTPFVLSTSATTTAFNSTVSADALNVSGIAVINTPTIATTDYQQYNGPVQLTGASTLSTSPGTKVTFAQTITQTAGTKGDLTVAGSAEFDGNVTLDSLMVNQSTVIGGTSSLVTLSGTQTYSGSIRLAVPTSVSGSVVTFSGMLYTTNGDGLTSDATTVVFNGNVELGYLQINKAAAINTGLIATYGYQDFKGPVTTQTSGPVTFSADSYLTFESTLSGGSVIANGYSGAAGGSTVFKGSVILNDLTVENAATINASSITTTNFQEYAGSVTIAAPGTVTLTANGTGSQPFSFAFDGNINAATDASALELKTQGSAQINALVGNNSKLASLQVDPTSSAGTNAGLIFGSDAQSSATSGSQTFNVPVTIKAPSTNLTAALATFNNTVNGNGLAVTGNAVFHGNADLSGGLLVSGTTLLSVPVGSTASITTEESSQTYTGPVTLSSATTLTGSQVTFGSMVNGGDTLAINSNTIFNANVAVAGLNINGTATAQGAANSIVTTGGQLYQGNVMLSVPVTTTGLSIEFDAQITGSSLASVGATTFKGAVNIASLSVQGKTTIFTPTITTTDTQVYNGDVALEVGTYLTGSSVDFRNGVSSDNSSSLTTQAGPTKFDDPANSVNIYSLVINGATEINTPFITTATSQVYNGTVTIDIPTAIAGTSVNFASTVNGASLTSNAPTTFQDAVSVARLVMNNSTVIDGTSITTATSQLYAGMVTFNNANTIKLTSNGEDTNGNSITFNGTLDSLSANSPSVLNVVTTGKTTFNGEVGGGTLLGNLTVDSTLTATNPSLAINGGVVSTAQGQIYNVPVTLGSAAALNGTVVTFAGTLNGASLISNAATTFDGAVKVADLTVNGTAAINTPTLTTSNFQDYNGAVTIAKAGGVTLTANGTDSIGNSVTFATTLDGASTGSQSVDIVTAGPTVFQGAVGSGTALLSLQLDANATTSSASAIINGLTVRTTATQIYNVPVTLGQDTIATASTITFARTLAGASLTSNAATTFDGYVNIQSLTANGTTAIDTPLVTTDTFQTYNGAVTLASLTPITLTSKGTGSGGQSLSFNSTVDSAAGQSQSLDAVAAGMVTFVAPVGKTAALQSLQVDPYSGSTNSVASLAGGVVTTRTSQQFNVPVNLAADAVLNSTTVTFNGIVNGPFSLSDNAGTIFNGTVAIVNLTANGTTAINAPLINTIGVQAYNGAVTFGSTAQVVLTATGADAAGHSLTFASTLDAAAGLANQTVDVVGAGTTAFNGKVGSINPLQNLSVDAAAGSTTASVAINAGQMTTASAQTFNVPVTLAGVEVFNAATVTFSKALGGQSLNSNASTMFEGAVNINDLTVNGITDTNITPLSGTASITTAGSQVYNGALKIDQPVTMNGSTVAFKSTVNGQALTTTAATTFDGNVSISALTVNGTTDVQQNAADIATTTSQTYNGKVVAGVPLTIDGTAVTFNDTLKVQSLTDNAATAFNGAVSGQSLLMNNTTAINVAATSSVPSVSTTGSQTYVGAVTLGSGSGNIGLNAGTGAGTGTVTFENDVDRDVTVSSPQSLSVTAGEFTTFEMPVGSMVGGTAPVSSALQSLSVNGPVIIGGKNASVTVNTVAQQFYSSTINLTVSTTLATSLLSGANVAVGGAVSDTSSDFSSSLSIMGYQVILHGVSTGGDQTYKAAATPAAGAGFTMVGSYSSDGQISLGAANPSAQTVAMQLAGDTTFQTTSEVGQTSSVPRSNDLTLGVVSITGADYNFTARAGTTYISSQTVNGKTRQSVLPTGVITLQGDIYAKSITLGWAANAVDSSGVLTAQPPAISSIVFEQNTLGTSKLLTLDSQSFNMQTDSKMAVLGWKDGVQIGYSKSSAGQSLKPLKLGGMSAASFSDISVEGNLSIKVDGTLTFVGREKSDLYSGAELNGSTHILSGWSQDAGVDFVATQNLQIDAAKVVTTPKEQPRFAWGDAGQGSFETNLPAGLTLTTNSVAKYVGQPSIQQGQLQLSQEGASENQTFTTDLVAAGASMVSQDTTVAQPTVTAQVRYSTGLSQGEVEALKGMGISARAASSEEVLDGLDGRSLYYQNADENLEIASPRLDTALAKGLLKLYDRYYLNQTDKIKSAFDSAWQHRSDTGKSENLADVRKALYDDRTSETFVKNLRQLFAQVTPLGLTSREASIAQRTILGRILPDSLANFTEDDLYSVIMDKQGGLTTSSPAKEPIAVPAANKQEPENKAPSGKGSSASGESQPASVDGPTR